MDKFFGIISIVLGFMIWILPVQTIAQTSPLLAPQNPTTEAPERIDVTEPLIIAAIPGTEAVALSMKERLEEHLPVKLVCSSKQIQTVMRLGGECSNSNHPYSQWELNQNILNGNIDLHTSFSDSKLDQYSRSIRNQRRLVTFQGSAAKSSLTAWRYTTSKKEEIHGFDYQYILVATTSNQEIESLEDLEGKRIGMPDTWSTVHDRGIDVLEALNIPEREETKHAHISLRSLPRKLMRNQIDVFIDVATNCGQTEEVAKQQDLDLISFTPKIVNRMDRNEPGHDYRLHKFPEKCEDDPQEREETIKTASELVPLKSSRYLNYQLVARISDILLNQDPIISRQEAIQFQEWRRSKNIRIGSEVTSKIRRIASTP